MPRQAAQASPRRCSGPAAWRSEDDGRTTNPPRQDRRCPGGRRRRQGTAHDALHCGCSVGAAAAGQHRLRPAARCGKPVRQRPGDDPGRRRPDGAVRTKTDPCIQRVNDFEERLRGVEDRPAPVQAVQPAPVSRDEYRKLRERVGTLQQERETFAQRVAALEQYKAGAEQAAATAAAAAACQHVRETQASHCSRLLADPWP